MRSMCSNYQCRYGVAHTQKALALGYCTSFGGMAERLNATVLKTVGRHRVPRVRISLPPPASFTPSTRRGFLFMKLLLWPLTQKHVSSTNMLLEVLLNLRSISAIACQRSRILSSSTALLAKRHVLFQKKCQKPHISSTAFTFAQVDFFRVKQSVAFGKKGEAERGFWHSV